jgi:cell shape-determining protein MreC
VYKKKERKGIEDEMNNVDKIISDISKLNKQELKHLNRMVFNLQILDLNSNSDLEKENKTLREELNIKESIKESIRTQAEEIYYASFNRVSDNT